MPRMLNDSGSIPDRGFKNTYSASGVQEVLICEGRGLTANQLDLLSLTPLSVAGSGRPQLGVDHLEYFSIITAGSL